jgi:O-antigen/teichoic acid export membrane protein
MVGTAAGQAIMILASPLLARVYTPDQFGAYGVYVALVSIAAVVVALRYDAALPLPAEDDEAVDLLALSAIVAVVMSLLIGLAVWLAVTQFIADPSSPLRALAWLMPLGLLLTGFQQILTFWATRQEAFRESARSNLLQGATMSATQLALGVLGAGTDGLGSGYVLARATGVASLAPTVNAAHLRLLRRISLGRLRTVAVRHRRFPLFALGASLLNSASVQAPVLVLAALFEATVVGWFSITVRVLQLPGTILGNAVGQVFYARVSRSDLATRASTTRMVYRSLLVLGTGPMALLVIGGEEAFALVFGEAWRGAGLYARWLAPWLLIVLVTAPLSSLVYVANRQRTELGFQALLLVTRVATLVAGAELGGATVSIALYGAGSAGMWAAYLVWLLRVGGVGIADPLRWLVREVVIALLLTSPLVLASALSLPVWAWVVAAVASITCMVPRALRVVREIARQDVEWAA